MKTPLVKTIVHMVLGGVIVFVIGLYLGDAG